MIDNPPLGFNLYHRLIRRAAELALTLVMITVPFIALSVRCRDSKTYRPYRSTSLLWAQRMFGQVWTDSALFVDESHQRLMGRNAPRWRA